MAMWEDPGKLHETPKLDRETIVKWCEMASLRQFNIWHDTNSIIRRLCKEILRRMDDDKPSSK
jgi:hypothetical protein